MGFVSVFEFRFSTETTDEGFELAREIGADMPPTEGYVDHQVIRDVADPGHVMVITRWGERSEAEAVLNDYLGDPKVGRATELLGGPPGGFLGSDAAGRS